MLQTFGAMQRSINAPALTNPSSHASSAWLLLCSAGLTAACAGLLRAAGALNLDGVTLARNILSYAHIALAYCFSYPVIRRELGTRGAAWTYVGGFLLLVAAYAAVQRFWLSLSINLVLVMALFMAHHASNELLFRAQSGAGALPFALTRRRVAWVALAVAVVVLDRIASPAHPWHAAALSLGALWACGWAAYGAAYTWRAHGTRIGRIGWIASGLFGLACFWHPSGTMIVASRFRFSWIVIFHVMAWYVFYTQRLLARHGAWQVAAPTRWAWLTRTPAGFVCLAVAANAAMIAGCLAALPLSAQVNAVTGLDFFQLHTVAHILFGAGVPQAAALLRARAARLHQHHPVPQFA